MLSTSKLVSFPSTRQLCFPIIKTVNKLLIYFSCRNRGPPHGHSLIVERIYVRDCDVKRQRKDVSHCFFDRSHGLRAVLLIRFGCSSRSGSARQEADLGAEEDHAR